MDKTVYKRFRIPLEVNTKIELRALLTNTSASKLTIECMVKGMHELGILSDDEHEELRKQLDL